MARHMGEGREGHAEENPHDETEGTHPGRGRRGHDPHHEETVVETERREDRAREKFGGLNWGACFFGWLVAIAMAILLTSIVGAVATAVGTSADLDQYDDAGSASTLGIAAAIVLLAVLMIGYYAGGYVAGRMSRFDGARQGMGVWVIGLIVTIIAVVLGAVFGSEYNILERVQLPSIPLSSDELGLGAIITAVAVVVGTLLAAVAGGKVGHRYHNRVDRAARL